MGAARTDQDRGPAILAVDHPHQLDPSGANRRYRVFPEQRRGTVAGGRYIIFGLVLIHLLYVLGALLRMRPDTCRDNTFVASF